MNLPTPVRIGGIEYSIVYDATLSATSLYGRCNSVLAKISIEPERLPTQIRRILTHEILHAISDQYALNIKELQINFLAMGLLEAIDSNPELLQCLRIKPPDEDGQI